MKDVLAPFAGALKKDAQSLAQWLAKRDWRDLRLEVRHEKERVRFALKRPLLPDEENALRQAIAGAEVGEASFSLRARRPRDLREALEGTLSNAEMEKLVTSFDSVGDIGVIEIPAELQNRADAIGWALLQVHPHFKTILQITGAHQGPFRVQPVSVIAGLNNTVATYREKGVVLKVDLSKAFFSPRLGTERDRIASLIRPGETVGCLFAGVGPFPIVFCRHSKLKKAVAVELNPLAVSWLRTNVELNRMQDRIEVVEGDVRDVVPNRYANAFDRAVMPLPHGGEDFLPAAIAGTKSGGIIHFYSFEQKENAFESAQVKVQNAVSASNASAEIALQRVCRTFSPLTVQVVTDFCLTKK